MMRVFGWLLWSATAPAPVRDCLAGVCLGDTAKSQMAPVATVAGTQWLRTVDVCAGKVVQIYVVHGWAQPGFDWTDLPAAAVTQLSAGEDGQRGLNVYNLVADGMTKLGWVRLPMDVLNNTVFFANAKTQDVRGMTFMRSGEFPQGWLVAISAMHADTDQLCAKKNLEGL
jgi:hypothetical protein